MGSKCFKVKPQVVRPVRSQKLDPRTIQDPRAPHVADLEMVHGARHLDQALKKVFVGPVGFVPKFFPHLVCFKEVFPVKKLNADGISGVHIAHTFPAKGHSLFSGHWGHWGLTAVQRRRPWVMSA